MATPSAREVAPIQFFGPKGSTGKTVNPGSHDTITTAFSASGETVEVIDQPTRPVHPSELPPNRTIVQRLEDGSTVVGGDLAGTANVAATPPTPPTPPAEPSQPGPAPAPAPSPPKAADEAPTPTAQQDHASKKK